MALYRAKCIVPAHLQKHDWPDTFEIIPREGDYVRPLDDKSVEVVVKRVVHDNHQVMHQPPTSVARIELHCEQKQLLG